MLKRLAPLGTLIAALSVVLGLLAAPPAMAANGSISGHTDGEAFEEVFLIPVDGGFAENTYVDDAGNYVFESVQPGSYLVCWHDFYVAGGFPYETEPRDCYQAEHYPGRATPVTVASGQARSGIDLTTGTWGLAVGQVLDHEGAAPESSLTARALVWSEREARWQEVASSGVSGGYYDLGVATGVPFRICVDFLGALGPASCLGGLEVWDADDQTVGNFGTSGPDELPTLTLPEPADITGTVTDPGGDPIPDVTANAYRLDANGDWQALPFIAGSPNVTDANGTYHLPYTVPGTYRVCFVRYGAGEWNSRCWGSEPYPPGGEDHVDEADDIVVSEGELVDGVDVTLTPFVFIKNQALPQVSGKLRVGAKVTATDGSWTPEGVSVAHEWRIDGQVVDTGKTFAPLASQVGDLVTLRVTASKDGGEPKKVDVPVGKVELGRFTMTTAPKVSGKAKVGKTVKVTTGTWAPTPESVKASWCVSVTCYEKPSLKLKKSMRGKKIYAKVTVSAKGYKTVWESPKQKVK